MFNHREVYNPRNLWLLHIASMSIIGSLAMFIYFQSTFVTQVLGSGWVTPMFVASSIGSIIVIGPFLAWAGRRSMRQCASGLVAATAASLLLLALAPSRIVIIIAIVVLSSLQLFSSLAVDILTEFFSVDRLTGSIRAIRLELFNIAIMLAPLIAGWLLASRGGFPLLLVVASAVLLPAIVTVMMVSMESVPRRTTSSLFISVRRIQNDPALWRIMLSAAALQFFYGIMVIYTGLYLSSNGYSVAQIGMVLFLILIPFVIFQYPAGIIADRWLGEKELLALGTILMGTCTIAYAVVPASSPVLVVSTLFVTRIGASLVEVMRDSAFFKHIDGADTGLIAILWLLMPLGYLLAAITGLFILSWGGYDDLFIATGVIVLCTLPAISTLKDTR